MPPAPLSSPVARAAERRGEDADLPFKSMDGAVDVRFAQPEGDVVAEVASGKVVGAVEHEVGLPRQRCQEVDAAMRNERLDRDRARGADDRAGVRALRVDVPDARALADVGPRDRAVGDRRRRGGRPARARRRTRRRALVHARGVRDAVADDVGGRVRPGPPQTRRRAGGQGLSWQWLQPIGQAFQRLFQGGQTHQTKGLTRQIV